MFKIFTLIGMGSAIIGAYVLMAVSEPNTISLAVVAMAGGLISALMTGYGTYRKINKEYGVDENAELKKKLEEALESLKQKDNHINTQEEAYKSVQNTVKAQSDMIIELNEQIMKMIKQHDEDNELKSQLSERIQKLLSALEDQGKKNDSSKPSAIS